MKYLSIQEKRELMYKGKDVPVCIKQNISKKDATNGRDRYIVKIRSIWNGQLKNKRIKL